MTGQGTIQTAVEAMKAGAFDYILKPFRLQQILPVLDRALEVRRLRVENVRLRRFVERLTFESARYRIVGSSSGDAEGRAADREGGRDRRDGAGPRPERDRQGTGRPGHPRQQPAQGQAAGHGQLRDPSGDPAGERTVRPREGRVHRGRQAQAGAVRGGRGRHAVHRRGRRDVARPCRPSCCGCWRTGTTGGSAARRSGTPTCGSWRPRTSRWRTSRRPAGSARTSSSG